MPRKGPAPKRPVIVDPVYGSPLVSQLVSKVLLDGTDIFALDEDGRAAFRKAKLGFVFQSFQLLAHLNAVENVMLPLELRGDGDARAKADPYVDVLCQIRGVGR